MIIGASFYFFGHCMRACPTTVGSARLYIYLTAAWYTMARERAYNFLSNSENEEGRKGDQGFFRAICCVGVLIVVVLFSLGIGIMIGYFAFSGAKTTNSCSQQPPAAANNSKGILLEWGAVVNDDGKLIPVGDKGADLMLASNIETNLKWVY